MGRVSRAANCGARRPDNCSRLNDHGYEPQMPNWTCFGRVLPERVPLTLATPLSSDNTAIGIGIEFTARLIVHHSQVIVDIGIRSGDPDLETIKNLAEAQVRHLTDLVGYLRGISFDVEMISAVDRDTDEWRIFGIQIPVLAKRRTADVYPIEASVLNATGEPFSQLILADFREAMRLPVLTGFFCYRAVEAMMQSMKVDDNERESTTWDHLRKTLRIERSALDLLKSHADLPRHGKISSISDSERASVFSIADLCIQRYLDYLTSSKTPLPDTVAM